MVCRLGKWGESLTSLTEEREEMLHVTSCQRVHAGSLPASKWQSLLPLMLRVYRLINSQNFPV